MTNLKPLGIIDLGPKIRSMVKGPEQPQAPVEKDENKEDVFEKKEFWDAFNPGDVQDDGKDKVIFFSELDQIEQNETGQVFIDLETTFGATGGLGNISARESYIIKQIRQLEAQEKDATAKPIEEPS